MRALAVALVTLALAAPPASASVRAGAQDDPAEGAPRGDLARGEVRYDDAAGALDLVADLHAAPAPGEPPTVSWLLGSARAGAECDVQQQTVGAEVAFEAGETTLRFQRGEEEETRIPARVALERSGLRVRITAADARLAGLGLACAALTASSGDDVPAFDLAVTEEAGPAPGPAPGAVPGGAPTGGYRFSRQVLTTRRSGRRVAVTVRALVCGPPGLIAARARFSIRRSGGAGFTRARTVSFVRMQRRRCQRQRFTWRLRTATGGRYAVRATLVAEPLLGASDAERPAAAAPRLLISR